MDRSSPAHGRRTLTPAVLGSALFAVFCAVFAVAFVASRGGLQMPIAPTPPAVAIASPGATSGASITIPTAAPSAAPSVGPTSEPSPTPGETQLPPPPSTAPSPGAPTLDPSDPLLRLPPCPGFPGCFEYTIQRGDSLSGIASRYAIPVSTVRALNPDITDPSVVVVGHVLFLGRDPFVRLSVCDDQPNCSLYTIHPGDRLSTIAARFGITLEAILAANPEITDPSLIKSGQIIRLPHPKG